MSEDFTEVMRECDSLLDLYDEAFVRPNDDPAYPDESKLNEAVLDNVKYYDEDRKAELVEIFYSILSQIRQTIVLQDKEHVFCNPQLPGNGHAQLPQIHMLMRCMMPVSWALAEKWEIPELKNTRDAYLQIFSEKEISVIYKTLEYLFRLFPQEGAGKSRDEFLAYWKTLSENPEQIPAEPESAKILMPQYLLKKHSQLCR